MPMAIDNQGRPHLMDLDAFLYNNLVAAVNGAIRTVFRPFPLVLYKSGFPARNWWSR